MPEIAVTFEHSRTADGTDVAAVLRKAFPEADIAARLDDDGAVSAYVLTLHFDGGDRAVDAAFRLTEYLRCEGIPYEAVDPRG